MSIETQTPAPEWSVETWFNHPGDLHLADLRGRVVVLEAFQMLCPGCVSHGLPQAQRVREVFTEEDVAVIGLHSVFEHHEAMQPHALKAFLHEYGIRFPVGVDRPTPSGQPETMALYALRGTPSLLLFDRDGRLRAHHFGVVSDMKLGAEINSLLVATSAGSPGSDDHHGETCSLSSACSTAGDNNPKQRS